MEKKEESELETEVEEDTLEDEEEIDEKKLDIFLKKMDHSLPRESFIRAVDNKVFEKRDVESRREKIAEFTELEDVFASLPNRDIQPVQPPVTIDDEKDSRGDYVGLTSSEVEYLPNLGPKADSSSGFATVVRPRIVDMVSVDFARPMIRHNVQEADELEQIRRQASNPSHEEYLASLDMLDVGQGGIPFARKRKYDL